LFCW